ncbi:alpha-amylase family glycosyl hydrolase [Streptomyces sp. AD681]|uniref:alpha-amylase family glycosyl hydrolase n=1 Tax=Streptomyces sp. AD681 TaxID=3019069 RepID=UPI003FA6B23E
MLVPRAPRRTGPTGGARRRRASSHTRFPGKTLLRRALGSAGPIRRRVRHRHDCALGLRRARAATALMLAPPGSAYLYQGEEPGLSEVTNPPGPGPPGPGVGTVRTPHTGPGDGCRVLLPWTDQPPTYCFSDSSDTWLPQPDYSHSYSVSEQRDAPDSTLRLYRRLLALCRRYRLGAGEMRWVASSDKVSCFSNGVIEVMTNFGTKPLPLPPDIQCLAASQPVGDLLPPTQRSGSWGRSS